KAALARLEEDERRQWQALWTTVEGLVAGNLLPTLELARAYVARGKWREAAERYALVFQTMRMDDGPAWFEFAAVKLLAGNAGYEQTRASMSRRAPGLASMRPYHVARAWTLAPLAGKELGEAARSSAPELRENAAAFWSLTQQAALLHRA